MRRILMLVGALAISSSSGVSAVACGNQSNSTVKIFDWNKVINKQFSFKGGPTMTSSDFFNWIASDLSASDAGPALYKDLQSYTALSIVKSNPTLFGQQYQFALQSIKTQIKNYQESLKAKYGRSWGSKWSDYLKDPNQGGDGITGSEDRYTDKLLKDKASEIVSNYYVKDSFHELSYYSYSETVIWLRDMYKNAKNNVSLADYEKNGLFANVIWIVAKSYIMSSNKKFQAGNTWDSWKTLFWNDLKAAKTIDQIKLSYAVAKTEKNIEPSAPDDYGNSIYTNSNDTSGNLVAFNSILSKQQQSIAKLWSRNNAPIWTKQIVIPFDSDKSADAMKKPITIDDFKKAKTSYDSIFTDLKTNGFESALKNNQGSSSQAPISDSSKSGDLGLSLRLNASSDSIKPSYQYYVYQYALSNQGAGQTNFTGVNQYQLPKLDINSLSDSENLMKRIIDFTNRSTYNGSFTNHSSQYNDEVVLTGIANHNQNNEFSGDGLATFIDESGLHIVQTRGITYNAKNKTTQGNDINQILEKVHNDLVYSTAPTKITFDQSENLINTIGGLVDNNYLDYLQIYQFYYISNVPNLPKSYDLNSEINTFTASGDLSANTWWDYIFKVDKNSDQINWNTPEKYLNENINASNDNISEFVKSLKTWFNKTLSTRWDSLQGANSSKNLKSNVKKLNDTWDSWGVDSAPARMNMNILSIYLELGNETIWNFNANDINN